MKRNTTLIFLSILLILSGCKISGTDFSEGFLGLEIGDVKVDSKRVLTDSEYQIATRVCAALMLKRSLFNSYESMKVRLAFNGTRRVCGATNLENLISQEVVIVKGSNLINPEFTSFMTDQYFTNIIFDNDEVFGPICAAINQSAPAWNSHENASYKFAVNFKNVNSRDIVEWIRVTKDKETNMEFANESNVAWINTNLNEVDRRRIGLEFSRDRTLSCGEDRVAFLNRSFVEFK